MSQALPALLEQLETLRAEGAWRIEPLRWRALEGLARRLPQQPPEVQALLLPRLAEGLVARADAWKQTRRDAADLASRLLARHPAQARELRRLQALGDLPALQRLERRLATAAAPSRLAPLRAALEAARASDGSPTPLQPEDAHELPSVRRARRTWDRLRSEDRVARAMARRPAQAGPLNPHALVLRSLQTMQGLSPDYLRRMLAQVETLLWLERQGAGKGKRVKR